MVTGRHFSFTYPYSLHWSVTFEQMTNTLGLSFALALLNHAARALHLANITADIFAKYNKSTKHMKLFCIMSVSPITVIIGGFVIPCILQTYT